MIPMSLKWLNQYTHPLKIVEYKQADIEAAWLSVFTLEQGETMV